MQTPCSDYRETKGLIYFARMLDKIRLNAQEQLAPGYFLGADDPTFFDGRCTRFLGINYDELAARTLQGGSDEEILDWCFEQGRRPSEEEILVWNSFISKHGWRDESSAALQTTKKQLGWEDRADIQTWVDLHDLDEGKKRRRRSIMAFEMIRLDRTSAEPLHQQLYRQIRDELRSGSFSDSSSRLPSSRTLAADLGISRLTVNLAFSKLHAEGYLRSRIGSGTFVADSLPETFLSASEPKTEPLIESSARLSDRVRNIPDKRVGKQFDLGIAGAPGVSLLPALAAIDEFPIAVWERLRAQVLAKKGAHLLQYASSRGDADLRKAIAAYLCDFRGVRCHPDQIVVTAGTQQAMMISALALVNPGEVAWIEDPGVDQARRVFGFAEATVVPRPVDREGIVIARPSKQPSPKIVFVTPSHQFPLGMTMSLARRTALIDFARARDAFIFEDDHDSEFRFTGPPLPCLQGLDNAGRVIYAGTMSQILYPSLRLGYLLAPEQLVEPMIKIRAVMDQHSSAIDQATLARFLTEGFFLSHVKRMRKLYSDRREFFIEQFNNLVGKRFILQIPEAGLNLVAWLRRKTDLPLITRVCAEIGIRPTPLSFFCIKAELNPALVFGFAAWSRAQIRESLVKLASALKVK